MLRLRKEFVTIDDSLEYKRVRVQLHQRGLKLRDLVPGSSIKTKKQQIVRSGDVLVAEIDAKVGGFGLVPEELDGAIVSSHYFVFEIDADAADQRFIAQLMRWPELAEQVAAHGSTNYAAIRSDDFLDYRVPLPPIDEQRCVASRLDRMQGAATELAHRSSHASELVGAFVVSVSARPDLDNEAKTRAGWRQVALEELLAPSTDLVKVEPMEHYLIAGLYSFGRGLIDRGPIAGAETSYKQLTSVNEGDIVVSKLNGWEGAVAVVGPGFDGYCVSSEYPTFKADRRHLLPPFFGAIARSPWFWEALNSNARGSMVRRRRINSSEFLTTQIWLPPRDTQARVAELVHVVDRAADVRQIGRARVEALLPAALNEAFAGLN